MLNIKYRLYFISKSLFDEMFGNMRQLYPIGKKDEEKIDRNV